MRLSTILEWAIDQPTGNARLNGKRLTPHFVYIFENQCGECFYIGVTCNLKSRQADHKRGSIWFSKDLILTYEEYPTRRAALNAEKQKIKSNMPKFNKIHTMQCLISPGAQD